MFEFLRYVLDELKNSFALALLAGVAALMLLSITYAVHKYRYKGEKRYPWGKALLWILFAGYMSIVLYATILRGMGGYREWNLHLFRAWREAWNNFSAKNWANVLLNVAMFGPLGFLLPLLGKRFRKWYLTVPAGFGISLIIELLQLAIGRGICDVDDLFCNTLGASIGYFVIMTILSIICFKRNHVKPVLIYGSLTLISVMAICSIFIVYQVKEYGNLPYAAAYANNTKGTVWRLECQLPAAEGEAPVYKTQTRSIDECDAFAEAFKKIVGTEYTTISYYQEAAYYMDQSGDENGAHFLFLSYLDPGYEYSSRPGDDPVWCDTDRETVEAALSRFPVFIPSYSEFVTEGNGWHTFTVDKHVDGAVMVNGRLRCRYAADGTIRELENKLLSYTYHDAEAIISPEVAYKHLCNGRFYDEGYFESKKPSEVSVLSCTLEYEIDTKGFYQPVYYFDMVSRDGSYADRVMIPAMQ